MRKIIIPLTALAVIAFAFASVSIAGADADKAKKDGQAQQAAAKISAPAPAFSMPDTAGKTHSLADYAGKIVVLEWINPACPFVERHYKLDTMTNLAAKSKDVVWLAIATGNTADADKLKAFAGKENVSYPILLDPEGTTGLAYGAKTTPQMFIIDKEGKLAYSGAIDSEASDDTSAPLKEGTVNYVDQALTELASGSTVSKAETKPYGCTVKYKK